MLNSSTVLPLYKQISQSVKRQIYERQIKAGSKIPSEIELQERYNVSRSTVRLAINDLVDQGILEKKQGKGTFVKTRQLQETAVSGLSFTKICEINNMVHNTKILESKQIIADQQIADNLGQQADDKVIYIKRIRIADGTPIMFEEDYYPNKFNYLLDVDLTDKSIYEIVSNKSDIVFYSVVSTISVAIADEEQSFHLNVENDTPLLKIDERVLGTNGLPLHYSRLHIRTDVYKYQIESQISI